MYLTSVPRASARGYHRVEQCTSDITECAACQGNDAFNDNHCPNWDEARKVVRLRRQNLTARRTDSSTRSSQQSFVCAAGQSAQETRDPTEPPGGPIVATLRFAYDLGTILFPDERHSMLPYTC
jgi:hypothetical protein